MDKSTLSNYGWVVCVILVLAIMISLATPFGTVIKNGVAKTVENFKSDANDVLDNMGGATSFDDLGGGGAGGAGGEAGGETGSVTMLDGDGAVYNKGIPETLSFRSSAPANELQEVKVDGSTISASNYTVTDGSTIITFKPEYAANLGDGEHTIEIVSASGTATADFEVTRKLPIGAVYYTDVVYCGCTCVNNTMSNKSCSDCYETVSGSATSLTDFPETPKKGDIFIYDGYEYHYKQQRSYPNAALPEWESITANGDGWGVLYVGSSSTPSKLAAQISGKPLLSIQGGFSVPNCGVITSVPEIPATVKYAWNAFLDQTGLTGTITLSCECTTSSFDNCPLVVVKTDCVDNNQDSRCDRCNAVMPHECVDETYDAVCDICDQEIVHECSGMPFCDICGEYLGHTCSEMDYDEDGYCDFCGGSAQ